MIFTLEEITTHLPTEQLDQGWELFNNGQITAPNIQRGGELITAVIQQGKRPLRVYIRTSKDKNGININGDCSCPQKENCGHIAAVLLQALHDKQSLPNDGASVLATVDNRVKNSRAASNQALIYVLQIEEKALLVETYVARRLDRGGYSIGQPYHLGRMSNRTPPRFLQTIDLELLPYLNQLAHNSLAGYPILAGKQSAQMLAAMIDSGRCFFQEAEYCEPLRLGPTIKLSGQWKIDKFAYQKFEWITDTACILLPLSTPWYIDFEKNRCGALNSDLPAELVRELAHLPAIAPHQTDTALQQLNTTWPGVALLPPLQPFNVEQAPPSKPRPCLRLTTIEEHIEEWPEKLDFAQLYFDYNGIEVDRHSPTTRLVDNMAIEVKRDTKAEQTAVKQLNKHGLKEMEREIAPEGSDCFVPKIDFMASTTEAWLDFQLEAVPALQKLGWHTDYDCFQYRLAEVAQWHCEVDKLSKQDWFQINLGIEVEGQRVDLLPILLDFLEYFPHALLDKNKINTEHFLISYDNAQGDERLLRLPATRVLPLLETLLEIHSNNDAVELRCSRIQLARFTALDAPDDGLQFQWQASDDDTLALLQRLREIDGIAEVEPPATLNATLRPYQQQGLNWLQFLRQYQLAGILADDMGLGKTIQALAHLLKEKEAGRDDRPSLVIAPTSLMFNWRHEAARFAPQLKVLVLHGPQRKKLFPQIKDHDLIITTYPLLTRDRETLLAHSYHLLILDEAQVIKNPKAQAARTVRELDARLRLCLTGTPMENHLGELWSLFDFLLPGLLGDNKQFRKHFRTPIEKNGDSDTSERLSRRIRPFLLRRTKREVATELPAKTEIIQNVVLEGKQRELYEVTRLALHRRVRDEIERQGLGRSHITVLDALLKLRQVCCDPRLVKSEKAQQVKQSAKLEMLMDLLPEMIEEGRRILLFSQFTAMLSLIEEALKKANIDYVKLTGSTRDRQTPVQQFQEGNTPLFLISLKAGGVGLNLTAADTVIHYDPWWNPAVERQATDRAHRIGQQQNVFVYKLICEGTLEEKIQAMQQRKQALADGLYQGGNQAPQWNEEDLDALFGPLD